MTGQGAHSAGSFRLAPASCRAGTPQAALQAPNNSAPQTSLAAAVTLYCGHQASHGRCKPGAGACPAVPCASSRRCAASPSAPSPRLPLPAEYRRGFPGPAESSTGPCTLRLSVPSSRSVPGGWAAEIRARSCYRGSGSAARRCRGAKGPPACTTMWAVGQAVTVPEGVRRASSWWHSGMERDGCAR